MFPGGLTGLYAQGDLVAQEERAAWRERLADISGYMKCLKEFIARRANVEVNCKGRFWEIRFRCQALLDDTAVIAAMGYDDLNSIRAGLSETLEGSDLTSVQERIELLRPGSMSFKRGATENTSENIVKPTHLMSFQTKSEIEKPFRAAPAEHSTELPQPTLPTTLHPYLALIDWTSRQIRKRKHGYKSDDLAPIFSRLGVDEKEWVRTAMEFNTRFRFAAGALGKIGNVVSRRRTPMDPRAQNRREVVCSNGLS